MSDQPDEDSLRPLDWGAERLAAQQAIMEEEARTRAETSGTDALVRQTLLDVSQEHIPLASVRPRPSSDYEALFLQGAEQRRQLWAAQAAFSSRMHNVVPPEVRPTAAETVQPLGGAEESSSELQTESAIPWRRPSRTETLGSEPRAPTSADRHNLFTSPSRTWRPIVTGEEQRRVSMSIAGVTTTAPRPGSNTSSASPRSDSESNSRAPVSFEAMPSTAELSAVIRSLGKPPASPPTSHASVRFSVPKYLKQSQFYSQMTTVAPSSTTPRRPDSPEENMPTPESSSLGSRRSAVNLERLTRYPNNRQSNKMKKALLANYLANLAEGASSDWTINLPTCWDTEDKSGLISVSRDCLTVSFEGSGKNGDRDAAAIRANRPIPPQCGVFFWEAQIVSKGLSGYIGVGFSTLTVSLSRLPGWEADSYGYHGDDGNAFCSHGSGKKFGPQFTTGDVIGCGIDWALDTAFYTKNGVFIGYAFPGLDGHQLYPSVGMRTPGEVVRANFGQMPFVFDIESYIRKSKSQVNSSVLAYTLSSLPDATKTKPKTDREVIEDLIAAHLAHQGHLDTLRSFHEQRAHLRSFGTISGPPASVESGSALPISTDILGDAQKRKDVRTAILQGDIEAALSLIQAEYPVIFLDESTGPGILFKLRVRQFIETIIRANLSESPTADEDMLSDDASESGGSQNTAKLVTAPAKSARQQQKQRATSPETPAKLLDSALAQGRTLQADYGSDTRIETISTLQEAFSLIAYNSFDSLPEHLTQLVGSEARLALAKETNSAILLSQGMCKEPPIEAVYRQASACISHAGWAGSGQAALIDPAQEVLRPND
ncbi:uncharacterized protein L969DRAFT_100801 [Mixia osmundae IAM 14324]|uniref:B30.2/SPRY domain-containing protein n=1 Tax=Mixia osmundae (strain CBS 9802 / IAM 14324 / JCM 22182 / KY 12970) TaxID=764103 RepID=G7EAF3_MIXOS|nr:uncharacterized protein L969DRAFT_100801 [Mixia osmundae IAM 14324]KEI42303.1 hypothetical protein L969DRAFT_100801 [Mixia osmundae IAM 14324]GAA99813.1 hypothetical protein E5Q_06516 [Mixia osmundae IAM 14324]